MGGGCRLDMNIDKLLLYLTGSDEAKVRAGRDILQEEFGLRPLR